jgi:hypothetical protein
MSHVVSVDLLVTDLQAVEATCKELGLTFKRGQTHYRWWGRSVGDYPLPNGFKASDLGYCEHAIEVPGSGYDIGLAKKPGSRGYTMLFDFFGVGRPIVEKLGGQALPKFVQTYGVLKATLEAKKKGLICTRSLLAGGQIKLTITGRFA